jgi:hypothetical protein
MLLGDLLGVLDERNVAKPIGHGMMDISRYLCRIFFLTG